MSVNTAWMDRAACAGRDPRMFEGVKSKARQAKWICRQCPVQSECAEYAIENRMDVGIWGGLSAAARDRQRRGIVAEQRLSPITVVTHDPSRTDPNAHGFSRFRRGCRCGECRAGFNEWHRLYQRERRAAKRLSA